MNKSNSHPVFFKVCAIGLLLLSNNFSRGQSIPWSVPKAAVNVKNPIPSNDASVKNGATIYKTYCSPCHGDKGKGDGPASASLSPKPADHTSPVVQGQSDGSMFYKISGGHAHTAMPPFKAVLNADQRWAVINYIRTLSRASQ